MMNWTIDKLSKNKYKLIHKYNIDSYIEVELQSTLSNNPSIILDKSQDLSEDNVIFYPNTYPTPDEDDAIIGNVYQYKDKKCIENGLVSVHIISTNLPYNNAKGIIESLCM